MARVLSDAAIPYIALDNDNVRVSNCRKKGMNVFYGDADQLKILQAAGAECAKVAVITLDAETVACRVVTALRNNYADLPIFVRASDRKHSANLEKAGATAMVFEAAEASLQLGSIVLASLDVSNDDIVGFINDYREDDYARLEEIISGSSG